MPPHRSIRAGWFAVPAVFLVLLTPDLCLAQTPLDADTQEVSRYALTEQGLAKFRQATTNLRDVEGWAESACEDHGDVASLDEAEARIERHPGAENAITSAGMSSREYVTFVFAMVQSGLGAWYANQAGGELPPGTSQANVDFYRAHEADLNEVAGQMKSAECEEAVEEYQGDDGAGEGYDEGVDDADQGGQQEELQDGR